MKLSNRVKSLIAVGAIAIAGGLTTIGISMNKYAALERECVASIDVVRQLDKEHANIVMLRENKMSLIDNPLALRQSQARLTELLNRGDDKYGEIALAMDRAVDTCEAIEDTKNGKDLLLSLIVISNNMQQRIQQHNDLVDAMYGRVF
jgi:hypothetical protein